MQPALPTVVTVVPGGCSPRLELELGDDPEDSRRCVMTVVVEGTGFGFLSAQTLFELLLGFSVASSLLE